MDNRMVAWRRVAIAFLVSVLFLASASSVEAEVTSQHFRMPASVQNSGGGLQKSSVFSLQNSLGQPSPPGAAQSADFALFAGFQSYFTSVPTHGRRGDVNNDESINVLDILSIANHILEIVLLSGDALDRADCDGNETINVLDMLGIANVILGIWPECPGGSAAARISPEAMELVASLKPYLSPEDFEKILTMAKQVQIPEAFALEQNYPNPFNPTTSVQFAVGSGQWAVHTTLKVHNILGQEVATLVDELKEPGYYTVTWDANEMPSGVYFCRLQSGNFSATRRMVLVR